MLPLNFRGLFLTLLMLTVCTPVSALTFRLSERDVNQMMQMAFPQRQTYNNVELTFTQPDVSLGAANNDVGLDVTMTAVEKGKTLVARATLAGRLAYRPTQRELQIERPTLTGFTVLENNLPSASGALDVINNIKGKTLPVILLLDFNNMELGPLANQLPKSISVANHQLLIEL